MMKRGRERERERERAGRKENNPVKDTFRMSEKGYLTYEEGKIPMTQIRKKIERGKRSFVSRILLLPFRLCSV